MANIQGIGNLESGAGVPGPAGVPGEAGPAGVPGEAGPAGAVGETGPVGAVGETGPVGVAGLSGPRGATGQVGSAGAVGATGSRGETGLIGPVGVAGTTGETGATGVIGPTGLSGPRGVPGAVGVPGETGSRGVPGLIGPAGVAGAVGPAGEIGPTGAVGSAGISFFNSFNSTTININSATATKQPMMANVTVNSGNFTTPSSSILQTEFIGFIAMSFSVYGVGIPAPRAHPIIKIYKNNSAMNPTFSGGYFRNLSTGPRNNGGSGTLIMTCVVGSQFQIETQASYVSDTVNGLAGDCGISVIGITT